MTAKKIIKKLYHSALKLKKEIRNHFIPTGFIVLYHRVANAVNDPHLLCVSPENFKVQVAFFKENFKVMPIVQLVQEIRYGKLKRNSLAITFDDGYADNLHNAIPILKEYNIPATIFITMDSVGQELFYWDKDNPNAGHPLDLDELKELIKADLVEIGAHTLTHPCLSKLSIEDQKKEISESKENLEKIINIPIAGLAYPFGGQDSFTKQTVDLVKEAGFQYACANIHERVTNRSDLYVLPRFIARNWDAKEMEREMKKWL